MKKITFIPTHRRNELPAPEPVKKHIPKWYKNLESWVGGKPKIEGLASNVTVKKCVPFLDSMTTGYVLRLHTDIQVTIVPGFSTPRITWMNEPEPIQLRKMAPGVQLPVPAGHGEDHWAWVSNFGIKLPRGYSALVTHPLNRHDLPFTTASGIMDADAHWASGNLPFFLKEGFEGIIEAGTPIAQIIPFKREDWVSEVDASEKTYKEADNMSFKAKSVASGYYKKFAWTRKNFN